MGMPWDNQPPRPQQPQPQYQPQPPPQPAPPPSVPVVARNPNTGEQVRVDMGQSLQQAIREAINTAITENKGVAAANADAAVRRLAAGKKRTVAGIDGDETVEEAFQSGAVTTMTFVRGISLDLGVALVAAFATLADGPGFSALDKDLWMTVVPALVVKTVVQTAMSYAMKAKFK